VRLLRRFRPQIRLESVLRVRCQEPVAVRSVRPVVRIALVAKVVVGIVGIV